MIEEKQTSSAAVFSSIRRRSSALAWASCTICLIGQVKEKQKIMI